MLDWWRLGRGGVRATNTCTSRMERVAFGTRGARRSENAMSAAIANATVVKKPKTF